MSKLATVTRGRATIVTELAGDQRKLPDGNVLDKYLLTTVLELATGKLVESRSECWWSSRGPAGELIQTRWSESIEALAPPSSMPSAAPETKSAGKE